MGGGDHAEHTLAYFQHLKEIFLEAHIADLIDAQYCCYVYEQKKLRAHNYVIYVDKLRTHNFIWDMGLYIKNQRSQNNLWQTLF
jgi:hypothetical protein